ncbi:enoyl-CoA hydratase-related protein [Desertimonas flava]|uniref:enoyl-CoA hydratase-related protein n=1 Tax=Desertimonas flava TaxID=2064846 RepID=UPI000E350B2C|nr:enoyl-CoA hydratase-related protein [Desertimonas flava]
MPSTATVLPAYEAIDAIVDGPIGIVTLNRPDRLNAWDWLMSAEMNDAFNRMDRDDDVRAIVLTGAGRAFCAGAGLLPAGQTFDGSLRREAIDERYPDSRRGAAEIRTPVIAAINGAAVGAGITMAMRADIRVAADDAKLGFVFNRRGVIPDADLLWSLPRQIGYAPAMDLLLTGRIFSGAEAFRLGLVSRSVPAGDVLDTALEIARDIAENVAPVSAAITKLVGRRFLEETDRAACQELESKLFRWAGQHADAPEGVNSFKERRAPRWSLSKNDDFPTELFDDRRP